MSLVQSPPSSRPCSGCIAARARVGGSVEVAGVDVQRASDDELRRLRGARAAMVFQDPLSSLDPYYAIGDQIAEVYRVHTRVSRRAARARAVEVLERVGIPDAVRRHRSRPHEFSGGMRQRVGIARALAADPRVIACDEPVSALDVTTQAQVVAPLGALQRELGLALVFVADDLAVVRQVSDRVAVMRRGRIVESGPADEVYDRPQDPYTRQLLAALPALDPRIAARRRTERGEVAVT